MEASIIMPLIFVLLLPFLFLLRSVYIYDAVQTAVIETAQLMEPVLYLKEKMPETQEEGSSPKSDTGEAGEEALSALQSMTQAIEGATGENGIQTLLDDLALQQTASFFTSNLLKEMDLGAHGLQGGSSGVSFLLSDFHPEKDALQNEFRLQAIYSLQFPFVSEFASLRPVLIRAAGRSFAGQETIGDAGAEGEDHGEEDRIYYRILNGTHYHIGSCYLLDKQIRTLSRSEAEAIGYAPCTFCGAVSLGEVVVTEGGKRYHAPGCYHVGGASIRITWKDIQEHGYRPCAICIGGGEWFG